MKINGEEVERVDSFDELRPGMIIYVTNCVQCDLTHRFFITKLFITGMTDRHPYGPGARLIPPSACSKGSGFDYISFTAVDNGRVYAVVDRMQEWTQTSKPAKRPEKVS